MRNSKINEWLLEVGLLVYSIHRKKAPYSTYPLRTFKRKKSHAGCISYLIHGYIRVGWFYHRIAPSDFSLNRLFPIKLCPFWFHIFRFQILYRIFVLAMTHSSQRSALLTWEFCETIFFSSNGLINDFSGLLLVCCLATCTAIELLSMWNLTRIEVQLCNMLSPEAPQLSLASYNWGLVSAFKSLLSVKGTW